MNNNAKIGACIAATIATTLGLALSGIGIAGSGTGMTEADFLAQCQGEILSVQPSAAPWVDDHCRTLWSRAVATASMAEVILALMPAAGSGLLSASEARAQLSMVQWSSETTGTLDEARVDLSDTGSRISFYWQQQGMASPYNIIDALRIRGATLRTLGCPQYPGATMGREKVMLAELEGQSSFLITVYTRPAPTGTEQGLYQVDVDFSGEIPGMAALQAGHYPGGGGRAFAVEPIGWVVDCFDPD